jgi:hypothetical protein
MPRKIKHPLLMWYTVSLAAQARVWMATNFKVPTLPSSVDVGRAKEASLLKTISANNNSNMSAS